MNGTHFMHGTIKLIRHSSKILPLLERAQHFGPVKVFHKSNNINRIDPGSCIHKGSKYIFINCVVGILSDYPY